MRLTIEALYEQLKHKKLANCYLLVSSASFLLQETRDTLWKTARKTGFSNRQVWEIKSQCNWDAIKSQNNEVDLFERPFIELRCARTLDAKGGNQLRQFVESLQRGSAFSPIVVISCEEWPFKSQRVDWFQKLAAQSTFVVIEHPLQHQMSYWLTKELYQHQLKLTQEALTTFANAVEGNLPAARQTIQKLALVYKGYEKPIELKQLRLVLESEVAFELFHLTEAILQNQPERAERILNYLEVIHTPPALVLGYLLKVLRTAAGVRDGLDRGDSLSQLFEKYNVWQKQQAGFKKIVQHINKAKVAQLFSLAHQADRAIKGILSESGWHYLMQLSLFLSGARMPLISLSSQG